MKAHYADAVKELGGKAQWHTNNDVLIWTDEVIERPTDIAIETKRAELQAAEPIRLLRERRDWLLAETDWMANKDVTLTTAWKTYRQALRDLPSGLDTVEKVNAVTWPTKPE